MRIDLTCFGIIIETSNGGTITSDLHGKEDSPEVTAAMDALESLIVAHAVAGVDIASPAYIEGIETAVEGCWEKTSPSIER